MFSDVCLSQKTHETGDTATNVCKENMMAMHFSRLFFLCLFPAAVVTVTLRLEAEFAASEHKTMNRKNASNFKSVLVTSTSDSISIPFCFYRPFSSANLTVVYSNDGLEDQVELLVNGASKGTFNSIAQSHFGSLWDVFRRSVSFSAGAVNRGYNMLTLTFKRLDTYGIEIDYIGVTVDDEYMTDDVLRCQLMISGEEPRFSTQGNTGVSAGYVKQHSYKTPCPEEDNVHLSVHHPSVKQYTLTASRPLYRSLYNNRSNEDPRCPNLGYIFWKFEDVVLTRGKSSWKPVLPSTNLNKASIKAQQLHPETPEVTYTVSFTLKGFSTGFIDAEIWTNLTGKFVWNGNAQSNAPKVRISYVDRHGQVKMVDTLKTNQPTVEKRWSLPEMTWSEERENTITVTVSDPGVIIQTLQLDRGYTGPDRPVTLYESDAAVLVGKSTDFWWRRPRRENLTVTVGSSTTHDLFFVALYVPVPWTGLYSKQQIFVLYQDGNIRLGTPPPPLPGSAKWIPLGTSVIVGRSDPDHLRPATSIKSLTFNPDDLTMALTYYDGSSCKLALTYTMWETRLKVTDLHFPSSDSSLPFASFRSMYVDFKASDSDSVQTNTAGPHHVMDTWGTLMGQEFFVSRRVESRHLTQSPNMRLTIDEA